jgi:hypothetical protein
MTATARSWAVRVRVGARAVGVGVGRQVWRYRAVRWHPNLGRRLGRPHRPGRPCGDRFRLRGEDLSRDPAIPPPRERFRPRTPVRQSAAAHGVERSLARPPDREAPAVRGLVLGLDRAAARAFPERADPRYPPGARVPAAVGVRCRIRPGRAARVPDVPVRYPGWVGPRAFLPIHPLVNGSPLSLRAAWVAHPAAMGRRNQARSQTHRARRRVRSSESEVLPCRPVGWAAIGPAAVTAGRALGPSWDHGHRAIRIPVHRGRRSNFAIRRWAKGLREERGVAPPLVLRFHRGALGPLGSAAVESDSEAGRDRPARSDEIPCRRALPLGREQAPDRGPARARSRTRLPAPATR